MECNTSIPFNAELISSKGIEVSPAVVNSRIDDLLKKKKAEGIDKVKLAVKAMTLTDLTSLSGDDTKATIERLCSRAVNPFPNFGCDEEYDLKGVHAASVCVYPARIADAVEALQNLKSDLRIAAVAGGFPSGQYGMKSRLEEIRYAIECGATEIDVVINRTLALTGKWEELYDEISQMREVCSDKALMKVILATGELGSLENVYSASMVAMMAGADFIKTSTGKEAVNATLPVGYIMIQAIKVFHQETKRKIGLKPAGGIRTAEDAIDWMFLVEETLGTEWLTPKLFRIGASGLYSVIFKILLEATNK